jgi:ribosomal protein L44E
MSVIAQENAERAEASRLFLVWKGLKKATRECVLHCECDNCRNRRKLGGRVQHLIPYASPASSAYAD